MVQDLAISFMFAMLLPVLVISVAHGHMRNAFFAASASLTLPLPLPSRNLLCPLPITTCPGSSAHPEALSPQAQEPSNVGA